MRIQLKQISLLLGIGMSLMANDTQASDEYFPPEFNLINLNGKNGFTINGINTNDYSGFSISGAGDVNGDGIDDFLIGSSNAGSTYVIFGSKESWSAVINLDNLNGTNGFVFNGISKTSGSSVSGAGDFNGDGIDDILIGDPHADNNAGINAGQSYVVFGSKQPWPADFGWNSLNGDNGFVISGINQGDLSGYAVSGVGDMSGDSIDDILIGAPGANGANGQSYVIFGSKQKWPNEIYLSTLDGTNGFTMNGINVGDYSGNSVSGAGDVNGDGIDDVLISSPLANNRKGQIYVVFGSKEQWPAEIDLSKLDGINGFVINGIWDLVTTSPGNPARGIGDMNGDGIDDILIGVSTAFNSMGQSYVVFGSKQQWPAEINLGDLDGTNGFAINGINPGDHSGEAVSGAGDVNGDGIADLLIGAPWANNTNGQSYVVFGSKQKWSAHIYLYTLDGINGFALNGMPGDYSGFSNSGVGDINSDGIDDLVIGAPSANNNAGQTFVIFGNKTK